MIAPISLVAAAPGSGSMRDIRSSSRAGNAFGVPCIMDDHIAKPFKFEVPESAVRRYAGK